MLSVVTVVVIVARLLLVLFCLYDSRNALDCFYDCVCVHMTTSKKRRDQFEFWFLHRNTVGVEYLSAILSMKLAILVSASRFGLLRRLLALQLTSDRSCRRSSWLVLENPTHLNVR